MRWIVTWTASPCSAPTSISRTASSVTPSCGKNSELIELKELFENGNKDKLAEHFDNNYLLTKEQNDLVDRLKCASMTRKELSKECLKLLSENEMIYEQLARKTCDCKRVKNMLITCNKSTAYLVLNTIDSNLVKISRYCFLSSLNFNTKSSTNSSR